MALKFEITGDNSNLLSSLNGARDGVRRTAHDIEQSGIGIEDLFNRIANGVDGLSSKLNSLAGLVGVGFGLDQLKGFVQKMSETRAYFQDIESSMEVFLGNQRKAAEFTEQLKDYAYYNMFEFSDLADASKQMIAYGNSVDTIIPRLDQLSNIATGTNADLMELVNLYNRAKSLGEVGSQSLASWATKGLVVKDVLKEMGIEVEGTSVSFEQLNMVLDHVTAEGGMFHDLMLNQMSNISAEQGQMEDNLTAMYNEIGEKYQDVITKWYKMNSEIAENFVDTAGGILDAGAEVSEFLLDHYSEIGKAIGLLIVTYGEYKASLIATRAIERTMANQANGIEQTRQLELQNLYGKYSDNSDIMAIGQETAAEEANTAAIIQNTASREGNVTAIDEQIAALERKMLSELDEYDAIIETAQAAVDAASVKEAAADSAIASLTEQIQESKEYIDACAEQYQAALSFGDAEDIETAKRELNTAATEAENAEKALATAQSNKESAAEAKLAAQKNLETAASRKQATQEKLTNFQKAVGTVQTKSQTAATGLWVAMTNAATKAMNGLKAAMMSNPFGVALAAITTIISLLPIFSDETSKASAEVERFGESAVKQTRNLETLMMVVDSTSEDSKVHKKAVDELCDIYEEYGFKIDDEIDKLQQLRDMHDLVTDAIHKEGEERQKANLLASYNDALEEATTKMRDTLQKAFENAEWNGSGTFDDWDADEYQERAEELTQIIGAIIQSEGDNLANLTGQELEDKIAEVNERIKKAYQDMGLQLSKEFIHSSGQYGPGYTIAHEVDVDAIGIMKDYADAIHSVTQGRTALLETFEKEKKSHPEVQKEVDYTTMSIADLAKEASKASDEVSNLGDQSASPSVDKTSIDDATDAAGNAKTGIDLLNGVTAKPLIDTSSINIGIQQTNTLLGNMFRLQNSPIFNPSGGNMALGFNPSQFGFGKTGGIWGNGMKPVWGTIGGKPSMTWMPDIPITDPTLLAQQELNNRVNGANSQKKVDDLLKEVNEAFNKATFDSDEYNFLKGLKDRLEKKSRKKSGKSGKKTDTASKIEKEQQKLEDLQDDLDLKRLRSIQDMQTRITDTRLDLMADGAEKVRLLQEQQNKEEIAAIERQKEDAIREYIDGERRLFEQQERIKKAKNSNYKEKQFDESAVDTSAIAAQYDELINLTREKQLQDAYQESLKAMRDYLKEYGTMEQQRLAITQEYEQKIAEATTPTARAALILERNQTLKDFDAKQFEDQIDWSGIFSDLQGHTQNYLIGLRDQLQGVINEGKLAPDQMAVVQEKLRDINAEISKQNGLFQFVGDRAREHSRLVQQAADAQTALNTAKEAENTAQQKVLATTEQIRDLMESVGIDRDVDLDDELLSQFDANSEEYKQMARLLETLRVGEGNLAKARRDTEKATRQAKNAEDASKRESAQAVADWFADAQQFITEKGIDQIPDLLNELGLGETGEKVSLGLSGFNNAAGAATDFASGNYVGAALKTVSAVKDFGRVLGIGSGNGKEVAETTDQLTKANEALKVSIDGLKDEISKNGGGKSIKSAQEALEAQRKYIENQRDILIAQQSYHHAHHSNAKNWNLDADTQSQVNSLLAEYARENGKTASWVGSDWTSFSKLSPEEMAFLRTHNAQLWQTLTEIGEYDKSEFFDAFADLAGSEQEIMDALKETLTQTTFGSLKSSFVSDLMDMRKDVKDFTEDFSEMLMQAMLDARISDLMDDDLQEFYDKWSELSMDASGKGYELTEAELNELSHMWDGIVNQGLVIRDQVAAITGYGASKRNSEQSASNVSLDKATYEQFDTYLGIATAQQIALEQGNEVRQDILSNLSTMNSLTAERNGTVSELRLLAMTRNEYLLDIKKSNREILTAMTEKMDDVISLLDEIR